MQREQLQGDSTLVFFLSSRWFDDPPLSNPPNKKQKIESVSSEEEDSSRDTPPRKKSSTQVIDLTGTSPEKERKLPEPEKQLPKEGDPYLFVQAMFPSLEGFKASPSKVSNRFCLPYGH